MKIPKSIVACALCCASILPAMAQNHQNPFLTPYQNKFQIPPFDQIQVSDFIPAIKAGIQQQKENITAINSKTAKPDFDNTILPS